MAGRHELAEFNVARMRADRIEDPLMEGFVSRLEAVNAVAEKSPGFVWRLQTDAGDATAIRPYADERWLVNLSVWESVEALRSYVYGGAHGALVRGGDAWFERPREAQIALWWIPAGHRPGEEEGVARLALLREQGPSAEAFDFASPFPPPS